MHTVPLVPSQSGVTHLHAVPPLAPGQQAPDGAGAAGTFERVRGKRLSDRIAADPAQMLQRFANRVDLSQTTTTDLVQNQAEAGLFNRLIGLVEQQQTVLDQMWFATRGGTKPGITAIFNGPPTSSKETGARVFAKRLERELYVVDYGKLIGRNARETMQRISAVLQAAALARVVLVFEDAEIMMPQRLDSKSNVSDDQRLITTHMLQKLRSHAGVVLLMTGHSAQGDNAILDTADMKIQFQFPDDAKRAELWRRALPAGAPTENIDFLKLARAQLNAEEIADVAKMAAAAAAAKQSPITMTHLRDATYDIYIKKGSIPSGELGQWA